VRALDASSPSFPRDAIVTPTRPPITNATTTAATIPQLRRSALDGSDCGEAPASSIPEACTATNARDRAKGPRRVPPPGPLDRRMPTASQDGPHVCANPVTFGLVDRLLNPYQRVLDSALELVIRQQFYRSRPSPYTPAPCRTVETAVEGDSLSGARDQASRGPVLPPVINPLLPGPLVTRSRSSGCLDAMPGLSGTLCKRRGLIVPG
jgi:hypothetical protein